MVFFAAFDTLKDLMNEGKYEEGAQLLEEYKKNQLAQDAKVMKRENFCVWVEELHGFCCLPKKGAGDRMKIEWTMRLIENAVSEVRAAEKEAGSLFD